ncbi:MAG: hypothetical protein ACLQVI_37540 [Polyangiaceae bacterium]
MKLQWWVPALAVILGVMGACGSSGNGASAGHADSGTDATTPIADGGTDAGDGGEDAGLPQSIFVVPASVSTLTDVHFFDHPWPSDYRRDANGFIILSGVYNPFASPVIAQYIQAVTGAINGFSTASFGYMRFATDIDPTTLPATPQDTLLSTSTVQIINVDPSSPEHDQRHLAQLYWRQAIGDYWQPDTLAVGPALGYPLLANTKYAIVVTNGVKSTAGVPIGPSPDLSAVLGLTPTNATNQPVAQLFAPALADIAALGIAASSIAHFTFFTTNDPTAETFAIADNLAPSFPAPTILTNADAGVDDGGAEAGAESTFVQNVDDPYGEPGVYDLYSGWYGPAPNYQQGVPPYSTGGGNFVFDSTGKAVLQNTFPMRFTLVVPDATACPMPANGYPIIMYAHGTGGDYRSVIEEENGVGDAMARQCIASIGTDDIFHGARPGAPAIGDPNAETEEELAFFNIQNPSAFRTNTRQSAIDVVQEARLFTQTHLTVPASISTTGTAIAFDSTKLMFMGHSQGSLNGPLYLAADPSAIGGVLSGASSDVSITLLDKTDPAPSVAGLWLVALGLTHPSDAAELNVFHPIMSFAQTCMDPIDPLVYMSYLVQHPRSGHAPKSIYQTEGVFPDGGGDTYAPPHGIEVGSVAIGLPCETPIVHPVAEEPFGGIGVVTVEDGGLSGNLADGGASGVLGQFEPPPGDDGHFVFFDVPQCRLQAAQFAANLAANPKGNVPPLSAP